MKHRIDRTFRGPYALIEVESVAGDFTRVYVKPRARPSVMNLPPGKTLYSVVGYRWPCGCETRGTATPAHLPACVWSACSNHLFEADERHVSAIPEGFDGGLLIARDVATLKQGEVLLGPETAPATR